MYFRSIKSTKHQTSDFHLDHKEHEALNIQLSS